MDSDKGIKGKIKNVKPFFSTRCYELFARLQNFEIQRQVGSHVQKTIHSDNEKEKEREFILDHFQGTNTQATCTNNNPYQQ